MSLSKSDVTEPAKVVSASTGVEQNPGSGTFSLTNGQLSDPATKATIVFDYGQCVGGLPVYIIDRATGTGLIHVNVLYSETAEGIDCETGNCKPLLAFP